jgi:3-methylcrotonyl-CoA carboxylase alpha subunit
MAEHLQLRSGDTDFRIEIRDGVVLVDGTAVETPRQAWSVADGDTRWVFLDGQVFEFEVQRQGRRKPAAHHASLSAPMPATVLKINVAPGDTVKRGDTLLVLEAMKMELPVRAPGDGVVTTISCREGDLVQPGAALIEMDE